MSDDNTTTQAAGDPEALGDAGKKALQAERAARESAEKRLRDVEATLERLQGEHGEKVKALEDEVKAAQLSATEAGTERDRYQVAYEKGLPVDLVDYIRGADREEMTASAERLVAHLKPVEGTPKPDMTQGATGQSAPTSTTDMFAQYARDKL